MELIFKKLYSAPETEYHLELWNDSHGEAYAYDYDIDGNKTTIHYTAMIHLEEYWRSGKYFNKVRDVFVTREYFIDNFYLYSPVYEQNGKQTEIEKLISKGKEAIQNELYPDNSVVNEAVDTFDKILNGEDNREVLSSTQ